MKSTAPSKLYQGRRSFARGSEKKKKSISGVNFVERRGRVKCDVIYDINSREGSGSSRESSGRIPVFFQSSCVWFQTFQNKTKRSPFTYFSKKRNKLESSHEKNRMDSNVYSPENERLEPENNPFEKKHHLPNYFPFFGFHVRFLGLYLDVQES